MIYRNTQSNQRPQIVRLESLPDGSANVWLTRDIREDDGGWLYDAGFFNAADVTEAEITADLDGWWAYAEAWERSSAQPTIEERVADMEAAVLALLGG